tara:strand:+ start:8955 stop:9401 length:447 start_codon:yes stop_codon:yes gene_type:complete
MPTLTKEQIQNLLSTPIIARLATVKPDGSPYLVPVWEYWDGEAMFIIPRAKSKFVKYLIDEPRVAVSCADDISSDHPRILIEGTAEIVEGPSIMTGNTLSIAKEMVLRYSGEAGLRYLEDTIDKPRYLVKITPEKITSWMQGWHPKYG